MSLQRTQALQRFRKAMKNGVPTVPFKVCGVLFTEKEPPILKVWWKGHKGAGRVIQEPDGTWAAYSSNYHLQSKPSDLKETLRCAVFRIWHIKY